VEHGKHKKKKMPMKKMPMHSENGGMMKKTMPSKGKKKRKRGK